MSITKRKVLFFLLPFILPLGIVLIFYLGFPFYAKTLINFFTKDYAVQIDELLINRPSWGKGLSVDRVVILYDDQYRLTFTQLSLQYGRERVKKIQAEDFILQSLNKTSSEDRANIETLLPQSWLPEIPEVKVEINNVRWRDVHFKQWRMLKDAENLSISAQINLPEIEPLQFKLSIHNNNLIKLKGLSEQEQSIAEVALDTRVKEGMLLLDLAAQWQVGKAQGVLFERNGVEYSEGELKLAIQLGKRGPLNEVLETFELEGQLLSTYVDFQNQQWDISLPFHMHQTKEKSRLDLFYQDRGQLSWQETSKCPGYRADILQGFFLETSSFDMLTGNFLQRRFWNNAALSQSSKATIYYGDENLGEIRIDPQTRNIDKHELNLGVSALLNNKALNLFVSPITILSSHIPVNANLLINENSVHVDLLPINNIRFKDENLHDAGISEALFHMPAQEFILDLTTTKFDKVQGLVTLNHGSFEAPLSLDVQLKQFSSKGGELQLSNQRFHWQDLGFGVFQTNAQMEIDEDGSIQAAFQIINACQQSLLEGQWQLGEDYHRIFANVDKLLSEQASLINWLNIHGLPIDIQAGHLLAGVDIDLVNPQAENSFTLSLDDGKVLSDGGIFDGVQFRFRPKTLILQPAEKERFDFVFEGKVESANISTESEEIHFAGKLKSGDPWTAELDHFRLPIFGGLVSMKPQTIDLSENTQFLVNVENLELAKLVETQQIENLSTTGKLSGEFPLIIKNGELELEAGRLLNPEGGLIQYLSPLKGSSDLNDQLKLTLDVLENFQYDVLDTEIAYDQGNLLLTSKIKGRNPEVAGGQRVDLNLNTELELLPALEVMRLTSGLQKQLEARVNNQQGNANRDLCVEKE